MWHHLPIRELQAEIGDDNLTFLEAIITSLSPEQGRSFLGAKSKLAKVVSALKDHTYFRDRTNLTKTLERLPEADFRELCSHINLADNIGAGRVARDIIADRERYVAFVDFFSLDKRFLAEQPPEPPPHFDSFAASVEKPKTLTKPFKTLKPYQQNCSEDALERLTPPRSRVLLQMPTGSGKTRTSMEIIASHLNSSETAHVVWLANSRELCEQAVQCFVEVWDHLGRHDCSVRRMWGSHAAAAKDPKIQQRHQFTVFGLQSAWSQLQKQTKRFDENFSNVSLIVIDEAHIAVAETYEKVIRKLSSFSGARILGLTATPGRLVEEETHSLSELFNNSIVSLSDPNTTRNNPIEYLRLSKVMSEVTYTPLINDFDTLLSEKELTSIDHGKDFSDQILSTLGVDARRASLLTKQIISRLEQGKQIIVFAPSVQNSFLLSSVLTFFGFASAHVSGATPPTTRDHIIQEFTAGKYQVLCNYGVLSTGFDAPRIDTVVIARPTTSPVLYSQMIGRGMRGPSVGGTAHCEVVEVIDTFLNQGTQDNLYQLFDDYWA